MPYVYLGAVVLASGLAGALFLRIADGRIAEAAAEEYEAKTAQTAESAEISTENRVNRERMISLFCLLIACNAIAAFMHFFYGDTPWTILSITLLCAALWACAHCDRKTHLIPNRVLLWAVLFRTLLLGTEVLIMPNELPYDLVRSLIAAAALFAVGMFCRLAAKGSIGYGDIKLLAVTGLYLETDRIWGSVFFTMVCSFLYSLFLLLTKRGTTKTEIPFAPLLLIGTVLSCFLTSV